MLILSLAVEEDSDQRLMIGAGKWVHRIGLFILALGLFYLGLFANLILEFRGSPTSALLELILVFFSGFIFFVSIGFALTYCLGRWIFDREEKKLHRFRPFRRIQTWSFDEIERVECWWRPFGIIIGNTWPFRECYLVLQDGRRIALYFFGFRLSKLPARVAEVVGVPLVEQKIA